MSGCVERTLHVWTSQLRITSATDSTTAATSVTKTIVSTPFPSICQELRVASSQSPIKTLVVLTAVALFAGHCFQDACKVS